MNAVDLNSVVNQIKSMSVMDLVALNNLLKGEFGVTDAMLSGPAVAVAAGAAGAPADAAVSAKTAFDVILKDAGANKISVIKAIREITGLGLKEAKDLCEAPNSVVKNALPKDEAEKILKQLTDVGANCEVK